MKKQLDHLCNTMETRPSLAIRIDENGCRIGEVMDILHSLPVMEVKNDLFMLANKFFLRKENMETFIALKEGTWRSN